MTDISEENKQPEYIQIDGGLRLAKFKGKYDFALKWYLDEETVKLVDGVSKPYDEEKLSRMYNYLNGKGELYFIEIKEKDEYKPIGDVTFWKQDMPIVIGDKAYRGMGIGYKVIMILSKRAEELGYDKIYVDEIYSYNIASQKTFQKAGFKAFLQKEKGCSYVKEIV